MRYTRGVRHEPTCTICYGLLEKILVYQVPDDPFFADLSGKQQILVLLTPWKTEGQDAAKILTLVQAKLAPIVTDIRNVKAVVGLVETRGRSGIIDGVGDSIFVGFDDLGVYNDDDGGTSD
ncbi:hypothetical protein DFH29DRAFT_802240 [Suillus ampliporus]|nr:hypothetical protein DFH29DRAFT_802240 [Suillus ampliporus]